MDGVTFGRYIPGNTLLHRLDPRIRIVCAFLLLVGAFLADHWFSFALLMVILAGAMAAAELSFRYIFRAVKPMLWMMVFLLAVNLLTDHSGKALLTLGPISLYEGALIQTGTIILRLILLLAISVILTTTTGPLEMTSGLEDLLYPLKFFKVPVREIAMVISIALRFIPTLIEEMNRILKAQRARGLDINNGSLLEKTKAMISLIVPLFASAFQKAEDVASAMDARGYDPDAPRTRSCRFSIGKNELLCLGLCILLTVILIILRLC